MKTLLTLSAFCLLGLMARAQTSSTTISGVRYSIGVDAGIPYGNLHREYPKVLGGSLQADVPINSRFFATFNASYLNMFGHTYSVAQLAGAPSFTTTDVHILPLKAGIKFFPIAHLYFQGEAGAAFLLNKAAYHGDKTAAFLYAPQIGLQVPAGGGSVIDAGIRYEQTSQYNPGPNGSSINFFSLRLAYGF